MGKTPVNIEKDLSRIAGFIANIRYAEPPDSMVEMVLAGIKPKKLGLFRRFWRRLRTPIPLTPLKLATIGASAFVVLMVAAPLFWRAAVERSVTQPGEDSVRRIKTVILTLDMPGASEVEVIGSFNDWSPGGVRMVWDKDRRLWVAPLNLRQGRYEYAFRVNGKEIVADPKAILHRDDGFGHRNSILMVGNGNGNETRI